MIEKGDSVYRVNVQTTKTLEELRALNARNDRLLADFGVDVFTLKDTVQELLEQFSQIRQHTGLGVERPELSFLDEFLQQREAKRLEAKLHSMELKSEIEALQNAVDCVEKETKQLECFLEESESLVTTGDQYEKRHALLEKSIEQIKGRQKHLTNLTNEIDLDELIANVRLLEEETASRRNEN
ncbi:hypothetical protein AND_001276 [Anopheles darlingi]|uniref:Uncharacterized protein n=1 Tax=Anopheles darlingi TaxID=43151 RepID=W5JRC2_ANODA|nr:uncharacterized protein LOC125958362 [Anopheles darlingi]ETN66927.1 hypothetical protein AND_001276 [Anopheles darlingi]